VGVTEEDAVDVVEVRGRDGRGGTTPEEPQGTSDAFTGTMEGGREGGRGGGRVVEEFVQAFGVRGDVGFEVDEEGAEQAAVSERVLLEGKRRGAGGWLLL
jgi:hypothetical protein